MKSERPRNKNGSEAAVTLLRQSIFPYGMPKGDRDRLPFKETVRRVKR